MADAWGTLKKPEHFANKAECAEWFGISIPSFNGWIRRGCPFVQRGNKTTPWIFDVVQVYEWRFHGDKASKQETEPENKEKDPELFPPKERKDWYEGEKARIACESDMIDLCVKKGTVVFIEDYRNEMARVFKMVANGLEICPDKIERKLGLAPEIVIALQEEIDAIRSILHNELTAMYVDSA